MKIENENMLYIDGVLVGDKEEVLARFEKSLKYDAIIASFERGDA